MTRGVCFLREPAQVLTLAATPGNILERSRLISLTLDASATLQDLGLPYEDMWDYIGADECQTLEKEAYWLRDNWFRQDGTHLPEELAGVPSLDRVAWSELFREALAAKALFERVVTRDVDEITICSSFRRPAICDRVNDVPEGVWAFLARQAGLNLRVVPPAFVEELVGLDWHMVPAGTDGRPKRRKFNVSQKIAREAKRLLSQARRLAERLRVREMWRSFRQAPIVFYLGDAELTRYSGIVRALRANLGDRLTVLTEGTLPVGKGGTYRHIASLVGRVPRRWPEVELDWSRLPIAEAYPYIFRNEHLRFHFEFYTGCRWREIAFLLTKFDRLFRATRPSAVLITDLPYAYQNAVCMAAKKLGILTVTVPHSATPTIAPVRLQADAAFVWTEDYKRTLVREGTPEDRVHVVGVPADMLFGAYPSNRSASKPPDETQHRRVLVLSEDIKSGSGLLPSSDISKYPALIDELVRIPDELSGIVDVCWKCHPTLDHYQYYVTATRRAGASCVKVIRREPLEHLVDQADVIVIPTPTSAYLAALFADKPIVFINVGRIDAALFEPAAGRCCLVVDNVADIWPAIRSVLFGEQTRKALVGRARTFRSKFAGGEAELLSAEQVARKIGRGIEQPRARRIRTTGVRHQGGRQVKGDGPRHRKRKSLCQKIAWDWLRGVRRLVALVSCLLDGGQVALRQLVRTFRAQLRAEGIRRASRGLRRHLDAVSLARPGVPFTERGGCLFVTGESGACRRYRCDYQAEEMRLLDLPCRVSDVGEIDLLRALDHFDLFVAYRVEWDYGFDAFVALARRARKPVIYDTDDLVLDPEAPEFVRWVARAVPFRARWFREYGRRLYAAVSLCDYVTVSTDPLAERVRRVFPSKKVFVNRNAMGREMVALSEDTSECKSGEPVITYLSGSATHDIDFLECAPAVARILDEFPDVRLLVAGELELPAYFEQYGRRVERHGTVPWQELGELHRRTWVNLAPLEIDSAFTACKSALKYFESGLYGVPTVASDMPAFDRDIEDGANGFLCRDTDAWYGKIKRLLLDNDLRRRMGAEARARVLANYTTEARAANLGAILAEIPYARRNPIKATEMRGSNDWRSQLQHGRHVALR